MRSPDEQEEFLEHGRFGEGKRSGGPMPPLVRIALLLVLAAILFVAYPLLFEAGRSSHGGIFYIVGAMYLAIAAVGCFFGEFAARVLARFRPPRDADRE